MKYSEKVSLNAIDLYSQHFLNNGDSSLTVNSSLRESFSYCIINCCRSVLSNGQMEAVELLLD